MLSLKKYWNELNGIKAGPQQHDHSMFYSRGL